MSEATCAAAYRSMSDASAGSQFEVTATSHFGKFRWHASADMENSDGMLHQSYMAAHFVASATLAFPITCIISPHAHHAN